MKHFFLFLFCHCASLIFAQNGIQLNTEEALESLTLFYSLENADRAEDVYLVDNCGNIINKWESLEYSSYHPKLLPTGNVVLINYETDNYGRIMEYDWKGNRVVDLIVDDDNLFLSYEVIVLENGNYLCLGRRTYSRTYFQELGYNSNLGSPMYCDVVVEINASAEIVWEWNICDHVIQERDINSGNYGSIGENPQLLNMDAIADFDWSRSETFMINGMDYNPDLDQIALSIRKMSEVAIIDHSTTTAEALTSAGGKYGKGGDILFRWGNPQNYGNGTEEDRVLYFQHNPNWIKYGPHNGKLICYNNGLSRPVPLFNDRYSSIEIFDPFVDSAGNYVYEDLSGYKVDEVKIELDKFSVDLDFFSDYQSGTQVLPNGHVLITIYSEGRILEVDMQGKLLWEYGAPGLFRSEKYSLDYPAFVGKDLSPKGQVWNTNYDCLLYPNSSKELTIIDEVFFYPNPATDLIYLNDSLSSLAGRIIVKDFMNKLISIEPFAKTISIAHLVNGMYTIELVDSANKVIAASKLVVSN